MKKNYSKKLTFSLFALVCLCSILFLIPSAFAQKEEMKILAVSELPNGSMRGSTADLTLEIRQGSGRVFLDSEPLSKLDTQLSLRFAKNTACKFAAVDCSSLDFLYTIRANSRFIGGPSAGAASTIITYSLLTHTPLRKEVAITGTINSGRLIGNVGGIKEKIEGAAKDDLKYVLIPFGEANETNSETNETLNMVEYGKELGVKVIPVTDLEESIYYFTGKNLSKNSEFVVSQDYRTLMQSISSDLCTRSDEILSLIKTTPNSSFVTNESLNESEDFEYPSFLTKKRAEQLRILYNTSLTSLDESKKSLTAQSYYSASSQCFGANINLFYLYRILENTSDEKYKEQLELMRDAVDAFKKNISETEYETIPSLQTALIIQQRLEEAENYIKEAEKYFLKNDSLNETNNSTNETQSNQTLPLKEGNEAVIIVEQNKSNQTNKSSLLIQTPVFSDSDRYSAIRYFALANERLQTTSSWARFFSFPGDQYDIDQKTLVQTCLVIIQDTQSRVQYAQLYLPTAFDSYEKRLQNLTQASDGLECIANAIKIKADVNAIMSSIGYKQDELSLLVDKKLRKASEVLAEETQKGRFPILGYSYYEYASTLKERDSTSSVIYSEYALEMSNLDTYFPAPQTTTNLHFWQPKQTFYSSDLISFSLFFFLLGISIGSLACVLVSNRSTSIEQKKTHKKQKKHKISKHKKKT